jgi:hypothetical protein
MRALWGLLFVCSLAQAGEAESVAQLLKDQFSDERFEVVCYSAVEDGTVIVMTADTTMKPNEEPVRAVDFQVNTWWIRNLTGSKPKFIMGKPGNVIHLSKASLPTEGGGQKSFVTWLLQETSPRSNAANHRVWVFDQVVEESGPLGVSGQGVSAVAPPIKVTCPVFKLK